MQNGMTMANEHTGLLQSYKRSGVGYTVRKIKKYAKKLLSPSSIKILIILIPVLISFFIFAFSREEELENVQLFGVSLSYPLVPVFFQQLIQFHLFINLHFFHVLDI